MPLRQPNWPIPYSAGSLRYTITLLQQLELTSMTDLASPVAVFSLEELREYVHRSLCRHENLLQDQSPISELPLLRGGRQCGLQFIVQGPRALRLSAIWASDLNVVYFYDSKGERYLKVPLRYRFKRVADAA